MDCQLTEINRFRLFRLLSVTEINRSPYRGGKVFGHFFGYWSNAHPLLVQVERKQAKNLNL